MASSEDKKIFYTILKRNIDNLCAKSPLLWTFKGSISDYIIKYIEPYVNAFVEGDKLNTDELSDFAAAEIKDKIEKFKKEYKEKNNENKIDI